MLLGPWVTLSVLIGSSEVAIHRAAVLLIVTLAAITAFAAGTKQPKDGSRRHDAPLAELRKVEIWVEFDYPGRAQYHPSRDWLVANGSIAEKGRTIEIASAAGFLSWQARPVMTLLHELAHAYHDRVFGHGDKRVPEA